MFAINIIAFINFDRLKFNCAASMTPKEEFAIL